MPKVMYVGHDASRTGAPVLMGSMLRWIRRECAGDVSVVLARGGPLLSEYQRSASCRIIDSLPMRVATGITSAVNSVRSERRSSHLSWTWPLVRPIGSMDVVVANTLAALELAHFLAGSRSRLVCHVHELDGVAERVLPKSPRREQLLGAVERFIATGPAVASMLIERWKVPSDKVWSVDPFIEPPVVAADSTDRARQMLKAQPSGPLILSVGAMRRRKGPDRFVDLIGSLRDHPSRPCGVWLGGEPAAPEWAETAAAIAGAGLEDRVRLIKATNNAIPFVAASDIVVSVAREDPFPLIAIEAGAVGVPVLGFNSGGLGTLLEASGSATSVLPIGDTAGLAARVAELLDDEELRAEEGHRLSQQVRANHLVNQVAPALWDAITG